MLFAQQRRAPFSDSAVTAKTELRDGYIQTTVLPLIRAGLADSAQQLVKEKIPGREEQLLLADAFYRNAYYTHAAHWLQRLYSDYPQADLQNSLIICLQKAGVQQYDLGTYARASELFQQAISLQPDDPGLYHAAAVARLRSGDGRDVQSWIKKGLSIDPEHQGLLQLQKFISKKDIDPEALEESLLARLETHPRDVKATVQLSKLYFTTGRKAEAIHRLKSFNKIHPGHDLIYSTLAFFYSQRGQSAEERQIYRDWLAAKPKADTLMLKIAATYEKEKAWSKARQVYTDYWHLHPPDETTGVRIGLLLERESRVDSALALYEQLISNASEPAVVFDRAGKLAFKAERYDKALDLYQQWHEKDPDAIEPLLQQGRIYELLNNRTLAIQTYKKAENRGGSLFSAYRLWRLYQQAQTSESGDTLRPRMLKRSLQKLRKIESRARQAALSPTGSPMLMTAQQFMFQSESDSLKAILWTVVDEWIKTDPHGLENALKKLPAAYKRTPLLYEIRGDIEQSRQNVSAALQNYDKALTLEPRSIQLQQKLARQYHQNGEPDKAFRLMLAAADLHPKHPAVLKACRHLAKELGQLPFLANRWEWYLRAHPDETIVREYLISVWNLMGRNDKVTALREREKQSKMKDKNDETID